MQQPDTTALAPLIQETMQRIDGVLTGGLTPEQARWARVAYRSTVLPYQLRFAPNDTPQGQRARVDLLVDDISRELGQLPGPAKYAAITRAYYFALLHPISQHLFELAQELYRAQRPKEELAAAARSEHDNLQATIHEMETDAPEALKALSDTISEALTDARYVMNGGGDFVSLRMNHFIEDQSRPQEPTCPGCGAPVAPGARFCIQCGTRLAS